MNKERRNLLYFDGVGDFARSQARDRHGMFHRLGAGFVYAGRYRRKTGLA